jgi:hypothetical protein
MVEVAIVSTLRELPLLRGVQEVEGQRVLAVSLLLVVLAGPPAPERWFGRLRRGSCETGLR